MASNAQTSLVMKIENLEPRLLLSSTLLGVQPDNPILNYDNGGTLEYDASNQALLVDATPLNIEDGTGGLPDFIFAPSDFRIQAVIDNTGALVSGVAGDDLIIEGAIDLTGDFIPDLTGTLLTGEITGFGAEDITGNIDRFDFTFTITGGQLAYLYAGSDFGVTLTSENSTFADDFTVDFGGGAKGEGGAIDQQVELASLGDFVWEDLDGDGVQDANEPGVENVTVTLTGGGDDGIIGTSDDTTDTTTTGPNGEYLFDNLNPGEEYKVTFSNLPTGYSFTDANEGADDALDSDADENTGMTQIVTLAPGEFNPTLDAGIVAPASLGDFVWSDLDRDGVQDANEPGVEGVTVTLTGGGEDGIIGTSDDTTDTTVTGTNGEYFFGDLNPGEEYKVTFTLPTGFEFTTANAGGDDTVDSDADEVTGMTQVVTLASNEHNPTLDAGLIELAGLGDFVWEDLDGDGVQDNNEPGVEGVTVILTGGGEDGIIGTSDDTTASTITDANGGYSFTNLNPGEEYKVTFTNLPTGFFFTDANQGTDDALDSDADVNTGMTQIVVLANGEFNPTLDAGILRLAGLGDFVWHDQGSQSRAVNGIQDNDEPGIANVLINLLDENGNVIDTTTTNTAGFYEFTGLRPGTYSTQVDSSNFNTGAALEGFFATLQDEGTNDVIDSDGDRTTGISSSTTLESGEFDPTLDFGFFTTGIDLEKTSDKNTYAPGETITYIFTVTNTGDVALSSAEVTDVLIDPSGNPIWTGFIQPGEVITFTQQYVVPSTFGATVVDFDEDGLGQTLAAGTVIDNEYASLGMTVTTNNPTANPAMIFDSANPTGGDWDLGTPNIDFGGPGQGSGGSAGAAGENSRALGNILIISEDADSSDPDDNASGGTLIFSFDNPVDITQVNVIDVDSNEPGGQIVTFDANGNVITTSPLQNLSNNSFQEVTIDAAGVSRMEVQLVSSGAVADIIFAGDGKLKNTADVTADPVDPANEDLPPVEDTDMHMVDIVTPPPADPGIDIEKFTNGVDADTAAEAVELAIGDIITWTYEVTNTGNVDFTADQVIVTDDAGTPGNTSDDFMPTLISSSDVGNDGILSAGETWLYEATGVAQDLGDAGAGATATFNFGGSSSLDGPDGNIRSFNSNGVNVDASAFSRDSNGNWATSFLGQFSSGLGVTNRGEGDGSNGSHRIDNVGRQDYVLLQFDQNIVFDRAFLASVVNDSDVTVWIGSATGPVTLSDAVLNSMTKETNNTGSSNSRWADVNGADLVGNVVVIAASVDDSTPEDNFKLKKVDVQTVAAGVYANAGVVTVPGATDTDLSHYVNDDTPPVPTNPAIDIEKFTNGVDADSTDQAVAIAAGDTVTWTYEVTNTGDVAFTADQVNVIDDAGTPGNTSDDFSPTLVASSDVGNDGILSVGETWIYERTGVAQDLGTGSSDEITFHLTGSSSTDGSDGNVRTFTSGGVTVNATAFSRDSNGNFATAYVGAYSSGLGVTNRGEGDGGNGKHRIDNQGRHDFIVLQFDQEVILDRAFLDSVVNDSDITVWIGNVNGPVVLSDSVLNSLTKETNNTGSSNDRWADVNNGELSGNVVVIAASVDDSTPEDNFKLRKVEVQAVANGVYANTAVATAMGASDSDASHYTNPVGFGDTPETSVETVNLSTRDVGRTKIDGTFSQEGDAITIEASGQDIWGKKDGFSFAYTEITGDVEIVAQVSDLDAAHSWAKAGLMIRDSMNAKSKHVSVFQTEDNGTAMQHRSQTGKNSGHKSGADLGDGPVFVKLSRVGDTFTGYVSTDGVNWQQISQQTVRMSGSVYVGLAVTSHEKNNTATATFRDVMINGEAAIL